MKQIEKKENSKKKKKKDKRVNESNETDSGESDMTLSNIEPHSVKESSSRMTWVTPEMKKERKRSIKNGTSYWDSIVTYTTYKNEQTLN